MTEQVEVKKPLRLNGAEFNRVSIVDDEGQLHRFTTKELFKINKSDITSDLMKFPAEVAWWGRLEIELNHQKRLLKKKLDQVTNQTTLNFRLGGEKLNAAALNEKVELDPVVQSATDDLNQITRLHAVVQGVNEALHVKHDMLKLYMNSLNTMKG